MVIHIYVNIPDYSTMVLSMKYSEIKDFDHFRKWKITCQ